MGGQTMPSSKEEMLNLKKLILEKYPTGITVELDLGDGPERNHAMDIIRDSTDEWIVAQNFTNGTWGFSYIKDYHTREPLDGLFDGPDKHLDTFDEVFLEICSIFDKK